MAAGGGKGQHWGIQPSPLQIRKLRLGIRLPLLKLSKLVKSAHQVTVRCLWKALPSAGMLSFQPPTRGPSELSKGGHFFRRSCPSTRSRLPLSVRSTHRRRRLADCQPKRPLTAREAAEWEARGQGTSWHCRVHLLATLLLFMCGHVAGLSGQLCLAPRGWTSVPFLTWSTQRQLRAGQ